MENKSTNRGSMFYVYIAAFLLVFFFIIAVFFMVTNFFSSPANLNPVLKIIPTDGTLLIPKSKPIFKIIFNTNPKDYNVYLYYLPASSGKPPLKIATKNTVTNSNLVTLEPLAAVNSLSIYTVKVELKSNHRVVFTSSYSTPDETPTPIKNNSLGLSKFLPHRAKNYSLEYLSSQNIYVFNFIYDINSSDSIDDQFDKAKNDAILFIKSKGIDPNSIVVDWRRS